MKITSFQTSPASYHNDESRRDVKSNQMISDYMGKNNNKSKFQLGRYTKEFWENKNNDNWRLVNNCYAYACNIRVDDKKLPKFSYPHPGFSKFGRAPHDRKELEEGIRLDGLIKIKEPEWEPEKQENGSLEQPVWLVVLGDGYTPDRTNEYWYHFYRKVWSGNGTSCGDNSEECFYAHKNGDDPVTNKLKGDSSRIIDPRDDMKKRGLNYIGYYLVPREMTIYAPSS